MYYHKKIIKYDCAIRSGIPDHTRIVLYGEANLSIVGVLNFEPDTKATLTPFRFQNGYPTLYFRKCELPAIIDLLRNESPVFLWYYLQDNTTLAVAEIGTRPEPVGEEETSFKR